jgi:hypothetical protein
MNCVPRGAPGFNDDRRIRNARIYSNPSEICYCYTEEDVLQALRKATPGRVRVRAGGHHHEGMCSGDNVLVIDVSNLNRIDVDRDAKTVRVGPGAKLGDIYNAVYAQGLLFPGGACGDVHVGGLVQGGGWGLIARRMGLTCDSLESIRIAIWNAHRRDFEVIPVKGASDPNQRLFWAVSGGGGGNFGVATEFVFKVESFPDVITQFTATWKDRGRMRDVIDGWKKDILGLQDERLTTFCRLIAPGTESEGDDPSLILGNFIGDEHELDKVLQPLLPKGFCVKYDPVWPPAPTPLTANFTPAHYQPGPPAEGAKLSATCAKDAFFRHKVSSAYPAAAFDSGGVQGILDHINVEPLSGARRYISLHSLGLRVAETNDDRSCFAYRDKAFLIQYQAWWQKCELDEQCLDWVSDFRDDMHRRKYTEGSFINFPDRDLVPTTDQKELMRPYYRHHLDELMGLKQIWDPRGIFDFPMGIPRP